MHFRAVHPSRPFITYLIMSLVPLFVTIILCAAPVAARPACAEDGIMSIDDIRLLRKLGEYEEASKALERLLGDGGTSDETLREGRIELVTLAYLMEGEKEAMTKALRLLKDHPDIEVDSYLYPPEVVAIFRFLREKNFGSVTIESSPAGAEAYVDGRSAGRTPLRDVILPAGEHLVELKSFGYLDAVDTITVENGSLETHSYALTDMDLVMPDYGLRFGIEAGGALEYLSYANPGGLFMGIGDMESNGPSIRFTGGLFLQIDRSEKAAVRMGLRYMNYGGRVDLGSLAEYEVDHHSFALSVLFRYYPPTSLRSFITIGPEFALTSSSRLTPVGGGASIDTGDLIRGDQLFIQMGAGIEFPRLGRGAGITLSMSLGLLDMKEVDSYTFVNYKPREVKLTAFYYLY